MNWLKRLLGLHAPEQDQSKRNRPETPRYSASDRSQSRVTPSSAVPPATQPQSDDWVLNPANPLSPLSPFNPASPLSPLWSGATSDDHHGRHHTAPDPSPSYDHGHSHSHGDGGSYGGGGSDYGSSHDGGGSYDSGSSGGFDISSDPRLDAPKGMRLAL